MAGRAPHKPRRATVAPPSGAHHFSLFSVTTTRQTSEETGRTYSRSKSKKLHGPALEDGTLPDAWPAADFSTRFVVEGWGPGSYRVDWYTEDGTRISGDAIALDTPPSVKAKRERRAHAAPDDDGQGDEQPRAAGMGLPQSPLEWMMYMRAEQRADDERRREDQRREDDRRRVEYERAADRDRQFMATVIGALGGGNKAGQPVDGDLLRREMAVTVREQMGTIRGELNAALAQLGAQTGTGDGDDGPEDLEDGANRIGLAVLREVEESAPELIEGAIPMVIQFLQGKGFQPSAGLRARLEALRKQQNGHG